MRNPTLFLHQRKKRKMNIPTYKSMNELIEVLKQMRAKLHALPSEGYPIQPVRVGGKIGFVNWQTFEVECLPLFDDYDRHFAAFSDCVCVRQGENWGVVNSMFRYELPIEHNYYIASQVCNVMNMRFFDGNSIRKYGTFLKFS